MNNPTSHESNLKIASLNCNGLRSQFSNGVPKRRKLFTWLKQLKFDVIFMQETHSLATDEKKWLAEWGGVGFFAHGDNFSRGVGILIRPNTGVKIDNVHADGDGRFITLELQFNGRTITVGNYYGPNSDNPRSIEEFCCKISDYENPTILLGGDFNFSLNIAKDRESNAKRIVNNDKCKETLIRFMEEKDLIDVWRELNPSTKEYTFIKSNPPSKSRIDFFVVSHDVLYSRKGPVAEIRDGYMSDHKMITLSLNLPTIEVGRSYWKFKNSLLIDENFVTMVRQKIPQIIQDNRSDASCTLLFETLLCVLRGEIIKFSSNKKREAESTLRRIEAEISVLQQEVNPNVATLENLIERRDAFIKDLTSKGMFKAKVRWRYQAETGTKYFHDFPKRNKVKPICQCLFIGEGDSEGREMTNVTDVMLKEGKHFFEKLYEERTVTEVTESFTNDLRQLSQTERQYCDENMNIDEISAAVFSIRNNISPGPSGFTGEFYKFFWPELKDIIQQVCTEIFQGGVIPENIKRSITVLIPKKGKDSRKIENMRPISLLNTFYKIITKCLANRLANVIKSLINEDQTGFLKGRYIGENVRLVLDMIDYCNSHKISALILACDVKNAYDCVAWSYMKHLLSAYGFGSSFRRWIDILYGNELSPVTASVIINGKISQSYGIGRGLRQGCPLSCLLFLLCFEPLLERIRGCSEVKGIVINSTEVKVSAYADDATIIMDGSPGSLRSCLKIFAEFASISGLELNVRKSQALWVGKDASIKQPICPNLQIHWQESTLEILGVRISNDPDVNITEINYERKYISMKNSLTSWNGRGLTPFGRIHLVKSEMLSQLVYLMTVLPAPNRDFAKRVESEIFRFVWGSKKDKIKRATLKSKYKRGGLLVPDIEAKSKSLKVMWIKKYLNVEYNAKWKAIVKNSLSISALISVFHCDGNEKLLKKKIKSRFWLETCLVWMELKNNTENSAQILNQVLWRNRHMNLEKNGSLRVKHLIEKGIVRVIDLYSIAEKIFLTAEQLSHKYVIHPITALTLLRSIPEQWRVKILTDRPCEGEENACFEDLNSTQKAAKWAYIKLTEGEFLPVDEKYHSKWQTEFNTQIEWSTVYERLHKSTDDVNLKWLHYQCIKRIIPTNRLLYIYGLSESDKCRSCPIYSETIQHRFWHCPSVRLLWSEVKALLGLQNHISCQDVVLGIDVGCQKKTREANNLIMITKQFIWKNREYHGRLTCANLRLYLKEYISIEKYISRIRGQEQKFVEQWENLDTSIRRGNI